MVSASATWQNPSGQTCYYAVNTAPRLEFQDGAGNPVRLKATVVIDFPPPKPLAPGQTVSGRDTWDQQPCQAPDYTVCGPAPPGTYSVVATYSSFGSATTTFQLVAG